MVHAFYLSCFMTRHAVVWELVELSADRSKRVGSGGHGWACSDWMQVRQSARPLTWIVVLPLHSQKKRGATA